MRNLTSPRGTRLHTRVALLACMVLVGSLSVLPAQAGLGPGCDARRPAVVHRAGGEVLDRAPVRVPCATETGHFTGETTIGVTDAGTVWFSAADWEWALVRSDDNGASWEKFVVPGPQ